MKVKTHSGLKKRIKVRASGRISARKASKNHLLDNKSKKQKKVGLSGYPVTSTRMQAVRRLMPGKVSIKANTAKSVRIEKVEEKPKNKAVKAKEVAPATTEV